MSDTATSAGEQLAPKEVAALIPASEYFRFLGAFYIHQDQLSWSRIQTVIAIEVAVLAVAFSRQGAISPLVCLLGGVGIVGVFWLMSIDRAVRDQVASEMQALHAPLGTIACLVPSVSGPKWLKRICLTIAAVNGLLFIARAYNLAAIWSGSDSAIVNLMR